MILASAQAGADSLFQAARGHDVARHVCRAVSVKTQRRSCRETLRSARVRAPSWSPCLACESSTLLLAPYVQMEEAKEATAMTIRTTLLDLVTVVGEFADTERELIAVVVHLVNSGRVTLIGNFKGARFDLEALAAAA